MDARIIQSLLKLRSSYYFIPGLMVFGAILLAILTTYLDIHYQTQIRTGLGWIFASTVTSARSVLTTIAGSMISVAAVTFSLTMVAVTTAAGQYGPRLIGNFMRDRANQITLGTFLATFLYCIVVLKSVSDEMTLGDETVVGLSPSLSVLTALLLTLFSVGNLIFFIHHIPETLNVGTITGKVSKALIQQIDNGRFPMNDDYETIEDEQAEAIFATPVTQSIRSKASGYIQAVSLDGMMKWAQKNGFRVRLLEVPGHFVFKGDDLIEVLPDDLDAPFDQADFNDNIAPKLLSFIALGRERTAHQNTLFLADELVEILARALSPGVNDPFTALNCLHWYGHICFAMMNAPKPHSCLLDTMNLPRIWTKSIGLNDLMDILFGQSRQYISMDENAARETLTVLYNLQRRSTDTARPIIDHHIREMTEAITESPLKTAQKTRLRGGPPYAY
jgi:uncharacterized membrane protein